MNDELSKSLTALIDETLLELEELKKSRFAASEIEIKGPGEGLAGKPSNGDLHAKKEDKKDDEDEEEDEAKKGENNKADPDGGHHKPVAGEGMEHGQGPEKGMKGGKSRDMSGENSKADPGEIHHEGAGVAKADDDEDEDEDKKDKDDKGGEHHEAEEKKAIKKLAGLAGMKKDESGMPKGTMKKSDAELDSLMKSFVDERVKPLEDKLSTILDMVNKIAEQPVAPKGVTSRTQPLLKSGDEGAGEPLSKGQVASKLFELKKSGSTVDSLDVTKAEMGQDLDSIIRKYKLS